MSDKERVRYTMRENYKGAWEVEVYSTQTFATAEVALTAIKSMYMLEDPNDIEASIEVRGNTGIDTLFGIGEK